MYALRNYTTDELLNIAINDGNELAEELYNRAIDEYEDEADQRVEDGLENSIDGAINLTKRLLTGDFEWVKISDGRWVLDEFNEDTNPNHNHIEVSKDGGNYTVTIQYGAYGETTYTDSLRSLKKAREHAIDKACDLAKDLLY